MCMVRFNANDTINKYVNIILCKIWSKSGTRVAAAKCFIRTLSNRCRILSAVTHHALSRLYVRAKSWPRTIYSAMAFGEVPARIYLRIVQFLLEESFHRVGKTRKRLVNLPPLLIWISPCEPRDSLMRPITVRLICSYSSRLCPRGK